MFGRRSPSPVVLPFVAVSTTPSLAGHTTKADVNAAKAKLNSINHQLEVVGERYNEARATYEQIQAKLVTAKQQMEAAQSQSDAARAQLGQRAAQAYTGMGSQLDTLLGAQDLSQFSDKLEFMGALAQSDADLATAADAARQQAEWATKQYNGQLAAAKTQLNAVNAQRGDLNALLTQAQTLYRQTSANYAQFVAAQRAAIAAQQQQDNSASTGTTRSGGGEPSGRTGGGSYNPPPLNVTGAQRAIASAEQELGVQYVFGAASPSEGFDCSGLTMWAWAQAGVSLPHFGRHAVRGAPARVHQRDAAGGPPLLLLAHRPRRPLHRRRRDDPRASPGARRPGPDHGRRHLRHARRRRRTPVTRPPGSLRLHGGRRPTRGPRADPAPARG